MIEHFEIKLKTVFNTYRLIETLTSIGFIVLSILLLKFQLTQKFQFGYYVIIFGLLLFGAIPISFMLNYLFQGLNQKIRVDYDKEKIYVQKNIQSFQFKFEDIDWVEIYVFSNEFRRIHFDYHYCKYFMKNGEILILNCLNGISSYFIPASIQPIETEQLFPYINNSTKRQEKPLTELQIFKIKYQNMTEEELTKIVNDKGYCGNARKAAQILLKKK
ncbi:hypothetical protein [uncultured Draconibacterium sp.]|uniref:hypothetical protein n=1 Tax=uncultured Draconibacterium sp. TaxID=1573823 RepID=UPI002AA6D56C|nr:hypothetical protein [uncultured Draconibacterium sp.]